MNITEFSDREDGQQYVSKYYSIFHKIFYQYCGYLLNKIKFIQIIQIFSSDKPSFSIERGENPSMKFQRFLSLLAKSSKLVEIFFASQEAYSTPLRTHNCSMIRGLKRKPHLFRKRERVLAY